MVNQENNIVNCTDNDLVNIILYKKSLGEIAFKELYRRNSKWVYNKAIQIVGSADADDVTQEIFVKAFLNLPKFKQTAKFSTWLFSISYRMCLNHIQKVKKSYQLNEKYSAFIESDNEIASWSDEDSESALMEMNFEALERILNIVEPIEKTILLMKYQDDMSIKDVSNTLDLTEGAVKMRLKRAKEKVLIIHKNEEVV